MFLTKIKKNINKNKIKIKIKNKKYKKLKNDSVVEELITGYDEGSAIFYPY